MNDAAVYDLARSAGITVEWTDYADRPQRVSLDAVRGVLTALGLSCDTTDALAHSRQLLRDRRLPTLIPATETQPVAVPIERASTPSHLRFTYEDGRTVNLPVKAAASGIQLPAIETAGYHQLEIDENTNVTIAVAPTRCVTAADLAPEERMWGLAAQLYGLRSHGDCGIGDMSGVTMLASSAAASKADALALSPAHALFAADSNYFSPYSPSSRLFYNPLHADPSAVFGKERVAQARLKAGVGGEANTVEASPLIDWKRSSRIKTAILRSLYDDFAGTDLTVHPRTPPAADFDKFRRASGPPLVEHALFETVHTARLKADPKAWSWKDWPSEWRDPQSAAVRTFAESNKSEVLFHIFLQWVTDRSFSAAQRHAVDCGMRIGLISDLAIGMSSAGGHAWASQADILGGLQIGAPPDLFNARGQNWGLTTFSPRALTGGGFAPFIATLRACMRNSGGVRIDHAMGLMRLWVIPDGADASEGAYLAYPLSDLLRLIALESHRHRAIVIGEDLGTVPGGFRDRLVTAGIYGMNVLWFEQQNGSFSSPRDWPDSAVAMTSTHDLPTVAGWWRGRDIEVRAQCGFVADLNADHAAREKDRQALWKGFRQAKATNDDKPPPNEPTKAVDAAVRFVADTPSRLALLPLEDALALEQQPNVPATIDEQPNWRRRYQGEAGTLLDSPPVRPRLQALRGRRVRGHKTK
jgi:4-alpha-glucanotransferase